MKIVGDIFNQVINDEYLPLLIIFTIIVMMLMIINIVLGTITGSTEEGFDLKKNLFGWLKMVATGFVIIVFGFVVDIFVVTINYVPFIEIETVVVTIAEIVSVIIVWCINLIKEIWDKIKQLINLKYDDFNAVKINTEPSGKYIDNKEGGIG